MKHTLKVIYSRPLETFTSSNTVLVTLYLQGWIDFVQKNGTEMFKSQQSLHLNLGPCNEIVL